MRQKERRYQQACLTAMRQSSFPNELRVTSMIWASKHRVCPTCSSAPYEPCWNMLQLRKNRRERVRWPHDTRVDWLKLYTALEKRGYMRGQEEA